MTHLTTTLLKILDLFLSYVKTPLLISAFTGSEFISVIIRCSRVNLTVAVTEHMAAAKIAKNKKL